jgi:hypothetical protein
MELTHQLTPMLRTLRLSGILETLEVGNRQAVEQPTSFVEFLAVLLQDEVEHRAQSKLCLRLRRAANGCRKAARAPRTDEIRARRRWAWVGRGRRIDRPRRWSQRR